MGEVQYLDMDHVDRLNQHPTKEVPLLNSDGPMTLLL